MMEPQIFELDILDSMVKVTLASKQTQAAESEAA